MYRGILYSLLLLKPFLIPGFPVWLGTQHGKEAVPLRDRPGMQRHLSRAGSWGGKGFKSFWITSDPICFGPTTGDMQLICVWQFVSVLQSMWQALEPSISPIVAGLTCPLQFKDCLARQAGKQLFYSTNTSLKIPEEGSDPSLYRSL